MNSQSQTSKPRFIAVVGPTASGKSSVAMALAKHCRGEIVCCDSVQLYRGFDIGSAKPSETEQAIIPHHLFSVLEPHEPCDAAIYARMASAAVVEICQRGGTPLVTGGTGLYLRALAGENWNLDLPSDDALRQALANRTSEDLYAELRGIDAVRADQLHPNDRFRVIRALEIVRLTGRPVPQPSKLHQSERDHLVIVMDPPRSELHKSIHLRTTEMLKLGLVSEVQALLEAGVSPDVKPMNSIGYKEVVEYRKGSLPAEKIPDAIEAATRQYAKRQCTWFKKIPRDFTLAHPTELESILPQLLARLT